MSPVQACRMCLSVDARMFVIADTPLQEVYEKITRIPLQSADCKPIMACYLCRHMLNKNRSFIEKSLKADGLLQEILDRGLEITLSSISEVDSASLKPSLTTFTDYEFFGPSVEDTRVKDEIEVKIERVEPENDYEEATDFTDDCFDKKEKEETGSKTLLPRLPDSSVTNSEGECRNNVFPSSSTDSNESNLIPRVQETNPPKLSDTKTDREPKIITIKRGSDNNVIDLVKCKHCALVLKSAELQDHIKSVHLNSATKPISGLQNDFGKSLLIECTDNRFLCRACDKSFTINNLQMHIRTHTGEKPYSCNECGKAFAQKQHLQLHLVTHTGEKKHRCDQCDKAYFTIGCLKIHKRTHLAEKPYRCTQCDKGFSHSAVLARHLRTHTGQRPHRCDQCDKTFIRKGHLEKHIRMHAGVKPYCCNECDEAFNDKTGLINHIRKHTGERPYRCSQCNKGFRKKPVLVKHLRTHTGEKPFRCSQCDMAYSQKPHLTDHMRSHTGEKPYVCHICNKAFGKKKILKVHIKTHSRKMIHRCRQCDKSFKHKGVLERHVTMMHK